MKTFAAVVAVVVALVFATSGEAKSSGPSLGFAPQTGGVYDYGIVSVGSHTDVVFTMTNSGGSATGALASALAGSSAYTLIGNTCAGTSLGPGKKCTFTVRYTPAGSTQQMATLTATSPKPAATASIILKGTPGAAQVVISPASPFDFGSSSASHTFTATNNGNVATAAYTFSGPTDAHFGLTATNSCDGTALAAVGGSCSFTVAFTAPAQCTAEPTLYQDSVSLGGLASWTIKGESPICLPHLQWRPCEVVFDPDGCENIFAPAGDTVTETFTLTNDGEASAGDLSFSSSLDPGFTIEPSSDAHNCQNIVTLDVSGACTVTVNYQGDGARPNPRADIGVGNFSTAGAELVIFEQCR